MICCQPSSWVRLVKRGVRSSAISCAASAVCKKGVSDWKWLAGSDSIFERSCASMASTAAASQRKRSPSMQRFGRPASRTAAAADGGNLDRSTARCRGTAAFAVTAAGLFCIRGTHEQLYAGRTCG